jgi:2-aminoethylphosphonate transport system permease protein
MTPLVTELAVGGHTARSWPRSSRHRWPWLLPPLVVVLGFFGYPLALVVGQSFTGGTATWQAVLSSAQFGNALLRTVFVAVGSTIGCALLGTFLALVVVFVPFPGVRVIERLVDAMLAVPSFLIALSFSFLYGEGGLLNTVLGGGTVGFLYSQWGLLLAEVTFYTPFVLRPMVAAFGQVPTEQLQVAASLGAGPARVLRQVVLPEAWPALVSGACLTLLLTMNEFGIVLFIGAKNVITLPMLIYTKGIVAFDYPGACAVAVVNVLLSVLLYGAYRWAFGLVDSGGGNDGGGRRGDAALDPA